MDYFIIQEDSIPSLMECVKKFMKQGWLCQGSVTYMPERPSDKIKSEYGSKLIRPLRKEQFLQTMIKET
jgi:hypothetical protein